MVKKNKGVSGQFSFELWHQLETSFVKGVDPADLSLGRKRKNEIMGEIPETGVEPARPKALDPKSSVSTNSTIPATCK